MEERENDYRFFFSFNATKSYKYNDKGKLTLKRVMP